MDQTLTLADGRTLAWREYGDPNGTPVFAFHGSPGSRIWFIDDDPIARELGIHLLTPERPGCGLSSPQEHRTLRGWTRDVMQLADHLRFGRFGVMGGSGGAPHALACGAYLSGRVTCAVTFGSMAPLDANLDLRRLALGNRIGFFMSHKVTPRFPWLLRAMINATAKKFRDDPEAMMRSIEAQACPADRRALADPEVRAAVIANTREGYAQGGVGHAADAELLGRTWDFELGDVRVPVHLWHGEDDAFAPVAMGRYLADALPDCTPHFVPDRGHILDTEDDMWRAMLKPLARS